MVGHLFFITFRSLLYLPLYRYFNHIYECVDVHVLLKTLCYKWFYRFWSLHNERCIGTPRAQMSVRTNYSVWIVWQVHHRGLVPSKRRLRHPYLLSAPTSMRHPVSSVDARLELTFYRRHIFRNEILFDI